MKKLILITLVLAITEMAHAQTKAVLPTPSENQQKLLTAALKETDKAHERVAAAQTDEAAAWRVVSSIVKSVMEELKLSDASVEAYLTDDRKLAFRARETKNETSPISARPAPASKP